jgi:hypothetical protein
MSGRFEKKYFSYIVAVPNFIGGVNQNTRRIPCQHGSHQKTGVNPSVSEGYAVPVSYRIPIVILI